MGTKRVSAQALFLMKNELMQQRGFNRVSVKDFYRDVFPVGTLEQKGNYEQRRANMIYTMVEGKKDSEKRAYNTIVFDDLNDLEGAIMADFAVSSPVTYRGRNRTAKNAHELWGFCIDLDGVGMDELHDLLHQIKNNLLPIPTYLVNSGHGFHVYYLLKSPIPLYPYLHKPLNRLKLGLTNRVWNAYTSNIPPEKKQFQGIFQGFRMPDSKSKLGKKYPVTVFKTGDKIDIETLNKYVEDKYQMQPMDEYRLSLEDASKKYPQWYEQVIVNGKKSQRKWDIAGKVHGKDPYALYHWWIEKIKKGAFDGNRYNCIATLMTYGVKCDVPREQVLNDALELVPYLDTLTEKKHNPFTVQDVYDAYSYFNDCYSTYSISAIEAKTKIRIERNKRNGRKQKDHVKVMNTMKALKKQLGEEVKEGRPKGSGTAEQKVKAWREQHPEGKKIDCERETGLSRHTVLKWWQA